MLVQHSSEAGFDVAFNEVIDQNPPTGPAPRRYRLIDSYAENGGVVGFTTYHVHVEITGSDLPPDE